MKGLPIFGVRGTHTSPGDHAWEGMHGEVFRQWGEVCTQPPHTGFPRASPHGAPSRCDPPGQRRTPGLAPLPRHAEGGGHGRGCVGQAGGSGVGEEKKCGWKVMWESAGLRR